jgi:hypothetical protein
MDHFLPLPERRRTGTTEQGLRHTLLILAARFRHTINAGGFFALTLSDLPPLRQFGILPALAFVVSMLRTSPRFRRRVWPLGDKPDALKEASGA